MRIRIRIDRLVLHRASPLDPARFQGAFEAELVRLLTSGGIPSGMESSWRSGRVAVPALADQASPEECGRACAQRVYGVFV